MKIFTNYRESHQGRGADYHRSFIEVLHRAVLWEREQEFLASVLDDFVDPSKIRLLDFACGTGRVIGVLERRVGTAKGVDVSESMLQFARQNGVQSELIVADLTAGEPSGFGPFDLITAFRFFPNAEPELRKAAMKALAGMLAPGGRLVFNNHLNQSGAVFWVLRRLKKPFADEAVPEKDMTDLITEAGLCVERRFHTGVAPVIENANIFPRFVLNSFERAASHVALLRSFAQDIVYVCVKR